VTHGPGLVTVRSISAWRGRSLRHPPTVISVRETGYGSNGPAGRFMHLRSLPAASERTPHAYVTRPTADSATGYSIGFRVSQRGRRKKLDTKSHRKKRNLRYFSAFFTGHIPSQASKLLRYPAVPRRGRARPAISFACECRSLLQAVNHFSWCLTALITTPRVWLTRVSTWTTEQADRSSDYTGCCEVQPEHARFYVF
jgi:hypothetical protein